MSQAITNHCATTDFGCVAPPDAQLLAEGWQRRFITDAERAKYAGEMYAELGHEVRVETIALEALKEECHGCLLILKQLRAVYTREMSR